LNVEQTFVVPSYWDDAESHPESQFPGRLTSVKEILVERSVFLPAGPQAGLNPNFPITPSPEASSGQALKGAENSTLVFQIPNYVLTKPSFYPLLPIPIIIVSGQAPSAASRSGQV